MKVAIVCQMVLDAVPYSLTREHPGEQSLRLQAQLCLILLIELLLLEIEKTTKAFYNIF